MSDLVETYRGTVYPWHCDHMNHMNVMWYVGKFDEATWNFFALLGATPSYLRGNGRGMVFSLADTTPPGASVARLRRIGERLAAWGPVR